MVQGIFGLDRVYKKQVENIKDDNFESWPESATYGYFGGGDKPPPGPARYCTVDRLDFSNDTMSLPGIGLPESLVSMAAVSNSSYG
jgi:hypothetical protein